MNYYKNIVFITEKEQKTENFQDLNFKNNFYKENDSQDIKSKINNFLESLKDKSEKSEKSDKSDSDDAIIKSQKTQFIYLIFKSIRNIKKTDYKAIKQVSWKNNPKLYLYIIYCSLVYSLYNRIEYYINKDSHNKKLFEMEDYNNCIDNINIINEEIKKTEEEKNKKKDEIKQIVIDLKEKINKILEEMKKLEINSKENNKKIKEEIKKLKTKIESEKNKKIKEKIKNVETETKDEIKYKIIETNIEVKNKTTNEEVIKIKEDKDLEELIQKIKEKIKIMEVEVEEKIIKIKEEIRSIKANLEEKNKEIIEEFKIIETDIEEKIRKINGDIKIIEVNTEEKTRKIKEDIKIIEANTEEKTRKIKKDIKNLNELKNKQEKKKIFFEDTKNFKILLEGPFFTRFITNLTLFLKLIENNYNKRFKNLELKDNNDKILFEYYLLFLGNTDFSENVFNLAKMWNEFLIPLDDNEIQNKINAFNNGNEVNINFNKEERVIKIKIMREKITITNIDNYAIVPLIDDIMSIPLNINLEWDLNKYLIPTKYIDNLFVYKTKNIWKNFLFRIFNSNAYNNIKFSFFNLKQIDFLSESSILFKILDNIQFFTFNCIFNGNTISELFRIYINGLFNKSYNKSVSLLIYYSFFVVNNLHEIGGHFYLRFQYFYSLNEGFESPDIEENEKEQYSFFGKLRGKESGERLEIKLFGRVINKLTINEALYIMNINNYSKNIEEFKNNFANCNQKKIVELIDDSLDQFLTSLDINKEDLENNNYIGLYFSNRDFNANKELENDYFSIYTKHPLGLFEEPDENKINGIFDILTNLKNN